MSKAMTRGMAGAFGMASAVLLLMLALSLAQPTYALSGADKMAIDTNISGNSASAIGTTETCTEIASVGGTATVDVVVDSIPTFDGATGGIAGYGFNILYDATKLQVSAKQPVASTSLIGVFPTSSITDNSVAVPNTSGNFKVIVTDSDFNYESGKGVLFRLTFTAIAIGTSTLDLNDFAGDPGDDGDGVPGLYNSDTSSYPIGNVGDARIVVGGTCGGPSITPSPTPTQVVTGTPTVTPTGGVITGTPTASPTPSPTPSPSPTPCEGAGCPSITASPTPSPTPSPSPTPTVTPTPTPTASPTKTPTPTPTPTPTASPTKTASTSPTKTAAALPQTGGPSDAGGLSTWLVLLVLGGAAVVAAGGSLLTVRARKD